MKGILVLFSMLFAVCSFAQPGSLDKTFGNEGTTVFRFDSNDIIGFRSSAMQLDGKTIVVGKISNPDVDYGDFLVARFTKDGFIDSTFGINGHAHVKFNTVTAIEADGVCIQPDQKIVVVGYSADGLFDTEYRGLIARFNTDGSLDASFGQGGMVVSNYSFNNQYRTSATIDGKIIVIGQTSNNILLSRYLSDGTLDLDFGQNGNTTYTSPSNGSCVSIQNDHKVLVGGTAGNFSGQPDKMLVLRYLENGSLDQTFGTDGAVKTDYGLNNDNLLQIGLQSDGKIVGVGKTGVEFDPDDAKIACIRYTSDGQIDSSFGTDGKNTIYFDDTAASGTAVAIQQNDKILIAGYTTISGNFEDVVIRLNANGIQDSSFGTDGKTFVSMTGSDSPGGIFLQPDNKIVIAGLSYANQNNDQYISLARFNNDLSQKQILITKIKHWLQHHNGIEWNNMPGIQSYAVQRSMDGIHWTTVYRSQVTAYTAHYSDPTPSSASTTYYRLQTTSTSNAVANSNVVVITNGELNISLSPNPAKSTLLIAGLPINEKVKLTVVDFGGNIKLQTTANSSAYTLNIASLLAGNYVLKVETSINSIAKQFVKE